MTPTKTAGRVAAMEKIGEQAVVVGASVGGLLAACALADAYERVTVIERDVLPAGDENRRAVPQGRHAHALIAGGQEAIEQLLPGIKDEMIEDGAPTYAPPLDSYVQVEEPYELMVLRAGIELNARFAEWCERMEAQLLELARRERSG